MSRSWVSLHRAADPDFRARMDAAIDAARARLRAEAAGVQPIAKWRAINGEELTVRGANGRQTQIARARLKQWTPRTEARFLAALASCCNVAAACRTVGMSHAAAYNHYNRWPDFAARWDAALAEGYEALEMALIENAGRAFEPVDYEPDVPIEPMTFDQAITLLKFHQHRVHGTGKRPGRAMRFRRTPEDVLASIAKKLDRVEARLQRDGEIVPGSGRRDLDRGMRVVRGA